MLANYQNDSELSLFQSDCQFSNPSLVRGMSIINKFNERDLKHDKRSGPLCSTPDIDKMFKDHRQFLHDIQGKDISLLKQSLANLYILSDSPHSMGDSLSVGDSILDRFTQANLLLDNTDGDIPCQTVPLGKASGEVME